MNVTFRVLIIAGVFFIVVGALWITLFDQGFSRTMNRTVSEEGNWIPTLGRVPQLRDAEEKGYGSRNENALMTKANTNGIPITIFAAGDIAKCDGVDPWFEELLELVGLLPKDVGEEREAEESRSKSFLKSCI